jgi:hypothetical protein
MTLKELCVGFVDYILVFGSTYKGVRNMCWTPALVSRAPYFQWPP